MNFIKYYNRLYRYTDQTIVASATCDVSFKGARIGSPNNPLHSIPLAKTTNIVDSQHDRGCLRENVCTPK